jgi:hypothetical protein
MIVDYYDRLYQSSLSKNYRHLKTATPLPLASLAMDDLRANARLIISDSRKPPIF